MSDMIEDEKPTATEAVEFFTKLKGNHTIDLNDLPRMCNFAIEVIEEFGVLVEGI